MFPQSWVPTYAFMSGLMGDMIGYDPSSGMSGILRNAYVALFQLGSPAPTPSSTIASQTEATYAGYARQEVVWFPTYLDPLGPQAITGANLMFRATDGVTPNTITQLGLVSLSSGGVLLMLAALARPVVLASSVQAFTTAPVVQLSFESNYGGPLVWA